MFDPGLALWSLLWFICLSYDILFSTRYFRLLSRCFSENCWVKFMWTNWCMSTPSWPWLTKLSFNLEILSIWSNTLVWKILWFCLIYSLRPLIWSFLASRYRSFYLRLYTTLDPLFVCEKTENPSVAFGENNLIWRPLIYLSESLEGVSVKLALFNVLFVMSPRYGPVIWVCESRLFIGCCLVATSVLTGDFKMFFLLKNFADLTLDYKDSRSYESYLDASGCILYLLFYDFNITELLNLLNCCPFDCCSFLTGTICLIWTESSLSISTCKLVGFLSVLLLGSVL